MTIYKMTLKNAAVILWKRKFSFSGRSSRKEFWLGVAALWLSYYAVFSILYAIFLFFIAGVSRTALNGAVLADAFLVLYLVTGLTVFFVSAALNARRLHDIGKSGWWQLISLIPLLGGLVLFIWLLHPSDGDNKYGPEDYYSSSILNE